MAVDVGTGDGAYALRAARARPAWLFVGVDTNAEGLRDASARALKKPEKGGAPSALFARLALEELPGELAALASELTVILPWGSLLRAIAAPEAASLQRLREVCKPGASVRFVFGYGPEADARMIADLGLPTIDPARLVAAYLTAGFAVRAAPRTAREIGELSTTWAKKLAFSGKARAFLELSGTAT